MIGRNVKDDVCLRKFLLVSQQLGSNLLSRRASLSTGDFRLSRLSSSLSLSFCLLVKPRSEKSGIYQTGKNYQQTTVSHWQISWNSKNYQSASSAAVQHAYVLMLSLRRRKLRHTRACYYRLIEFFFLLAWKKSNYTCVAKLLSTSRDLLVIYFLVYHCTLSTEILFI
jgi:hypothetical protein